MKKLIITVLCLAIVCGGGYAGYKQYKKVQNEKITVDVVPVSYMLDSWWGDSYETYGVTTTGSSQKVTLDDSKLVKNVLVQEGDVVEVGTPLLEYDMTVLELETAQKENAVAVADENIKTAEKELAKLKALKPSEDAPKEPEMPDLTDYTQDDTSAESETDDEYAADERETESEDEAVTYDIADEITANSKAVSGNGTEDDPWIFMCSETAEVTADMLSVIKDNEKYAEFVVCGDEGYPLYRWVVDGSKIPEDCTDYAISSNVAVGEDGSLEISCSESSYGNIKTISYMELYTDIDDEDIAVDEQFTEDEEENSGFNTEAYDEYQKQLDNYLSIMENAGDNYMYTRAELTRMISEKETEIQGLEIDKKSAELEYTKAKNEQADGMVLSQISGVVKSVQDVSDMDSSQPFILVQGEGGITVEGTVSESRLTDINVGTEITVTSWSTGESATAVITEIVTDSVQDTGTYYDGMNNPNSSTYTFRAEITDECDISTDEGVSITFPDLESESGSYIPIHYVREENGRYYVMKADENNRLVKQYVKTGKIAYGYEIEIKGGLSIDDRICFPYGKNVKEGVKTQDSDTVEW